MFPSLRRIVLGAAVLLALLPSIRGDEGDVHLFAGNPSGAKKDKEQPDNYLLRVDGVPRECFGCPFTNLEFPGGAP
jgi:hypothetical protein